ncbi:MAG TPA: hypothetical protein VMT24_10570 [Aggregatilineaceae bacterium]|nr:hypothetical protein [Aggregatilineaceae bacterium]
MPSSHETFETDDSHGFTLAMESDPPLGNRTWAVVSLQLVDEITGKTPTGQISLQVIETGPYPRVASDGFVGLVGIPVNIFPKLKTQPYSLHLGVQVTGYLPMNFISQVAQAPTFPAGFVPANLGVVELHTTSSVLRGRVVQISAAGAVTPVSAATVEVTGFWAKAPTPLSNPPASPPNLLAVFPPIYAGRSTGGGAFRRRDMIVATGQDKTLLDFSAAGSQTIALSDRVGISAGSLLWIEPANDDRMEIMEIAGLSGASTPQQPATATLTLPLAYDHTQDVLVQHVNPQPPGFSKTFSRIVYTGDTSLYLNNLTGVVPATIEITGDMLPAEYHHFKMYSATSGTDGYFRLPPVQRAGQLALRARHPPLANVEFNFSPSYHLYVNRVDFEFHP